MGNTTKPSGKVVFEDGKTTIATEVKSGNLKVAVEVSKDSQGTEAIKDKVEVKLPKALTIGVSAKASTNDTTGETGTSFEVELSKKLEGELGGAKWSAKAGVSIGLTETNKPSALDPGISMGKSDWGSSLKLTATVSNGTIEGKAEGSALGFGASRDVLAKPTTGAQLLSSTAHTASVFGQSLGSNLLQMKPAEFAAAQTRTETMAETIKLNMAQMDKGSPAYQAAANQLAGLEQSRINLKTAEVFTLAETAETAIRNNTGEWTKTPIDGGRTVMWENKTDGTKLISDRGAERVILVRGDGSGEAFSYTDPSGAPSESFRFASGAATQVKLISGGAVQVTDGSLQLLGLGTNGLAMSDASMGTGQGTSWVWKLNEDGKYERQFVDGLIRLEGAGAVGASTTPPAFQGMGDNLSPADHTTFENFRRSEIADQNVATETTPTPERPPSSTFVKTLDSTHATLGKDGTVSDIVLLQNKSGNPITADDIRAANPELNINDKYSNVRAGASLLIPTRVGDHLVTPIEGGGTQSVNTKTNETTTVIPNADGTTTQTTSSTDGEFTRSVRSITYDGNGEVTAEQRYTVNTLDNTRTPVDNNGVPTTDAALDQLLAAFGNPPVYSKANDILLADAGTTTGQPIVSDAGGGGSSGSETSAPNQPATPAEPAQAAPETIAKAEPATDAATKDTQSLDEIKAYDQAFAAGNSFSNMVHNWAHMDDAQRITGLIGLYNQIDTLPPASSTNPNAPNATSNPDGNLPGNVAPALNWLNVANSLNSLSQWDKMGDVAHLTATLSLYTQLSSVSTGGLAGAANVGTTLSYISLAQSIDKGDAAGIISSLNTISDHAIDGAINSALGSTGVPYIGIAMALNDFEHHPGQSIGALVGMYFGPIGSMLGSMIGSLLDEAFGPGKPPPPEGTAHYSWDASGTIQVHIDSDTSGGGAIALKTAHSLQGLLQCANDSAWRKVA